MDKTIVNKNVKSINSYKIILGIFFIVLAIILYKKLSKKTDDKNKIKEVNKVSQYLFFPKDYSSVKSHQIEKSYIRKPSNDEMSLSVFVKVNNWYHNFNNWKHILHKGTHIENETNKSFNVLKLQSPGLWFHPKINNLRFVLSVYKDFNFKHKYCDIPNIPIGKYFHIVFTVDGNTLSIFINKRLVKTCVFEGIPILTEGNVYVNYGITYDGFIKKLQFFDKVLSIKEIEKLYSED